MDITEFAITLNRISKIKRKPSIKFGGETEHYSKQTCMYSILDITTAVQKWLLTLKLKVGVKIYHTIF
jgi:hypothetical protein